MTNKNTYVKVRINDKLKANVNEIFAKIGLNASDAINLFYNYVKLNNGLPFEVKIPNKKTLKKY